ncbi:phosphopantetheine-binding protein, partial [Streptomyces spongiae]
YAVIRGSAVNNDGAGETLTTPYRYGQESVIRLAHERAGVDPRVPLSANGKVDRSALPAPDAKAGADDAVIAPRNELERQLADIWGEFFDARPVSVSAGFFDLGGDSMLAVRLMARIPNWAVPCRWPRSSAGPPSNCSPRRCRRPTPPRLRRHRRSLHQLPQTHQLKRPLKALAGTPFLPLAVNRVAPNEGPGPSCPPAPPQHPHTARSATAICSPRHTSCVSSQERSLATCPSRWRRSPC